MSEANVEKQRQRPRLLWALLAALLLILLCILLIYLIFVLIIPIKAVPDCPDSVGEGQSFTCDGSGSRGWIITDYAWDFGDGGAGSGVTVNHTYDDGPNLHDVTLTVTDRLGRSDSQTTQVTVNNLPPVADAGGPYACQTGAKIQLSGTCTDPSQVDSESLDLTWADFSGAAISEPTFTCPDTVGEVTVTLTCTDKDGASDQDSASVTVVEQGPTADADGPYIGIVGDPVSFDGSGSIPAETIVSYDWDFGDGETGTGVTVSHTYAVSGTFDVTLTVSDGTVQDSDTTTADITKKDGEPIPTIQVEEIPKSSGQCYTFDGSGSVDPDGEIVSYDWDLGDDTTASGDIVIVEHCYEESGTYTVTLTVTDENDLTGRASQEVTVADDIVQDSDISTAEITEEEGEPIPPEAIIQVEEIPKSSGQCYTFDGSDSVDSDGEIVSYDWDLGDDSTDTGDVVEHCYEGSGTYTVILTVTDGDDLTGSASQEVTVADG